MEDAKRKVTYRLYPSAGQEKALKEMLRLHQTLYNAALQERIDAYKRQKKTITYYDQCKSLTEIRSFSSEYATLNAQSEQMTLKRLHRAFDAFFRRIKLKEKAGFPRFKSINRYPGWGYATHGDGWRLHAGDSLKNGKLKLSGIGMIKLRGKAKTGDGTPKTCEIICREDKWYASVTIYCNPKRNSGAHAIGLDWGIETAITTVDESGALTEISNPRFSGNRVNEIRSAQRALAKRRYRSTNWNKARLKLARLQGKIARQRHDWSHKVTNEITKNAALIATEKLQIKKMSQSARGTPDSPGRNVKAKAGLNREILSTCPGKLIAMLKYKAEEAGIKFYEYDPKKIKPSQTCSGCAAVVKKSLSEREHRCSLCRTALGRDENAARVVLNFALYGQAVSGREPPFAERCSLEPSLKQESPSIAQA